MKKNTNFENTDTKKTFYRVIQQIKGNNTVVWTSNDKEEADEVCRHYMLVLGFSLVWTDKI